MSGVGFIVLFGLRLALFPCQGQITSPPDGTELAILNGSTATLIWSFNDKISDVVSRAWYFTSSDGSFNNKLRARIIDDDAPRIEKSGLSGVRIVKPAILILENVNQTYDGTYRFDLFARIGGRFVVRVFIAKKPTVTLNCSNNINVIEGDSVTCVCRGEGGNPPANVSWYKDDKEISKSRKEEQTLTLSNVDATDSGTYKCVAQSHTLMDKKSIEIIVYYAVPPTVISLTSTPENVLVGESVVITCEAIAVPLPSYTIIHNDTMVVSTHKTYIINVLEYSHAGSYKCIATSILGNSSKIFSLSVGVTQTTNAPTTKAFATEKTALEESKCSGTEWYIVVVSVVSGIIIGILLSYIVSCSRRKFRRSRNPQPNPEPKTTEADTTYQELDLTKMNAEDNYQSLRVNAPSNDEESIYTELNKTRDEENNYQSLT